MLTCAPRDGSTVQDLVDYCRGHDRLACIKVDELPHRLSPLGDDNALLSYLGLQFSALDVAARNDDEHELDIPTVDKARSVYQCADRAVAGQLLRTEVLIQRWGRPASKSMCRSTT